MKFAKEQFVYSPEYSTSTLRTSLVTIGGLPMYAPLTQNPCLTDSSERPVPKQTMFFF